MLVLRETLARGSEGGWELVLDVSWLAAIDLQAVWPSDADDFTPSLRDYPNAPSGAVGIDARQEKAGRRGKIERLR
jgi:hypothetical protein